MNIYRNIKTGRLVTLYRVRPRMVLGEFYETEDIMSGEVKRTAGMPRVKLVGVR